MPASEAMDRQAALLLHRLPERDRHAVLTRLTHSERRVVEPLLDELASLGIPSSVEPKPPMSVAQAELSLRERVAGLSVAAVLHAVSDCSASTIALLLRIEDWPWQAPLLEALPPALRLEVSARLVDRPSGSVAPGRRVGELLCERLLAAASAAEVSPATPSGRLGRLSWRLLRWT